MIVRGCAKIALFIIACIVICIFIMKFDKVDLISAKSFENSMGMEMVFISKGYWVSKYEVTQEQFEKIMGNNPAYHDYKAYNNPAICITGSEAETFCFRLMEQERLAERLPAGYLYALPSFKEWMEYAADASLEGSVTPGNYEYPNNSLAPQPAGSGEENRLGIYDLRGNVSEYSRDKFEGKNYILGGAWDERRRLRLTIRNKGNFSNQNDSSSSVGFRCVLIKAEKCL